VLVLVLVLELVLVLVLVLEVMMAMVSSLTPLVALSAVPTPALQWTCLRRPMRLILLILWELAAAVSMTTTTLRRRSTAVVAAWVQARAQASQVCRHEDTHARVYAQCVCCRGSVGVIAGWRT
jgi:hypothetical protein